MMKNMTPVRLVDVCNAKLVKMLKDEEGIIRETSVSGVSGEQEIAGAVIDSRLVQKDYLFFATVGERVDGHDFIAKAFDAGALVAVCERIPENVEGLFLLVKDSFTALKEIARFYRKQLDVKVVGITGSVGKTSTKEFIASVLAQKYDVLKTEGNFNNEVGLPLTILKIREEHEIAVLEMGISDFGEMSRLTAIAQPDICVITNIGQCHLENLGDRDGVLKAKSEIFEGLKEGGKVCLYGDDDKLRTIKDVRGNAPLFFGNDEGFAVYAKDIIDKGLHGSTCTIYMGEEYMEAQIPLPGSHMVTNALAATTVGMICGLRKDEIIRGIADVKAVSGRSNLIHTDSYTVIDDCYNANPVSVKAALKLLATATERKVAILGDMFELGQDKNRLHYEVGETAVKEGIDVIVCIGELSRNTLQGATDTTQTLNTENQVFYYESKAAFLEVRDTILMKGDAVLIKASHGMHFEELVSALTGGKKEDKQESVSEINIKDKKAQIKFNFFSKKMLWVYGIATILLIFLMGILFAGIIKKNYYRSLTQGVPVYLQAGTMKGVRTFKDAEYSYSKDAFAIVTDEKTKNENPAVTVTDGKYIYFAEENVNGAFSLYVSKLNGKDKKLVSLYVTDYELLSKGILCYATEGTLYRYEVNGDKVTNLCTNVTTFSLNEGKNRILALGNGILTSISLKDMAKQNEIDTGVTRFLAANEGLTTIVYEKGNVLYVKKNDELPYQIATGAENVSIQQIEGKFEIYFTINGSVLKCYKDGEKDCVLVKDAVTAVYGMQQEAGVFLCATSDGKFYFVEDSKPTELSDTSIVSIDSEVVCNAKEGKIFFVGRDASDVGTLYTVSNQFFKKGELSKIDVNILSLEFMEGKDTCICKEDATGRTELYLNGVRIATDVLPGSVQRSADGRALVYRKDISGKKYLMCFDGKEEKQIGEAVSGSVFAITSKEVYYISGQNGTNHFMKYNGKKSKSIAENVSQIGYIFY